MENFARLLDTSGLSLDRLRTFLSVVEAGGVARAARGDATRQSQYSRQIKELEAFFGAKLTRLVGRRLEITEDGRRLALVIRRQFRELDDFREAMAGRRIHVRIGSQGSIIDWLLAPRIGRIAGALGTVTVELEMMRTMDVARAVADGRLDFGILREDAVPEERERVVLGATGYSLVAPFALWKSGRDVIDVIREVPMVELLPGGQFGSRWRQWLAGRDLRPHVVARMASFTQLARAVRTGVAAAVLPDLATGDFDAKAFRTQPVPDLPARRLVLIANERNLDRVGLASGAMQRLAGVLKGRGKG